jgi:hypothetical protein
MATTTVPAFLDALKAQLEARAGLANVGIYTSPQSEEVTESIEFGYRITGTQGWAALGQRRRGDEYVVTGIIWKAADGAGEADAKVARDWVYDAFGELEEQLRTDPWVNNAVTGDTGAQITRADFNQWYGDRQRIARMEFDISCRARI